MIRRALMALRGVRETLRNRPCLRCGKSNRLTRDPADPTVTRFAREPFNFDMWECAGCSSWINMNAGRGA